jgi:hypothetical protein
MPKLANTAANPDAMASNLPIFAAAAPKGLPTSLLKRRTPFAAARKDFRNPRMSKDNIVLSVRTPSSLRFLVQLLVDQFGNPIQHGLAPMRRFSALVFVPQKHLPQDFGFIHAPQGVIP